MIIRKDTTKARRADKTTGSGAAPAPLACYRRDARTPASQRREGNPASAGDKHLRFDPALLLFASYDRKPSFSRSPLCLMS